MVIDHHAITHPGRVRTQNEDAYLVSNLDGEEPLVNGLRPGEPIRPAGFLAAVADGMGGAPTGEIASREGLASVAVNLFGHWGRFQGARAVESDLLRALKHAAEAASAAVLRYAEVERKSRGMGSTLTAAVIWNGHAYLAQVGDSRAYLFRGGRLVPITEDQTLVRQLVDEGRLTPEQARSHPRRSIITQALGGPEPIQVALVKATLRRGDRMLLCTDGLYGDLPDPRMAEILALGWPPERTLERMLQEALTQGGHDNITALLLDLSDPQFPLPTDQEPIRVVKPNPPAELQEPSGPLARLGRLLGSKAPFPCGGSWCWAPSPPRRTSWKACARTPSAPSRTGSRKSGWAGATGATCSSLLPKGNGSCRTGSRSSGCVWTPAGCRRPCSRPRST